MKLNLPILEQLKNSKNILVAGCGGGFDVFCGLPIYFTLREMGKNVHLANYSFSALNIARHYCNTISLEADLLEGATADIPEDLQLGYYPEGYLSRWFRDVDGTPTTIWMFSKVGPALLKTLYEKLIAHLEIDALILLDGGVDSLMIGDEMGAGTLLEDTISLVAVQNLDIPVKILGCLGFGSEIEVAHNNALDNMATLVKEGAFKGACALTKDMPVYQQYESASKYVWEQPSHHKSQINMRVVSAVNGYFDNYHMYDDYKPLPVFVSPLMSLYWFFDADSVIERSLLADAIRDTHTIEEAYQATIRFRRMMIDHARNQKPLPY
ncbi:MAG: DUF1152 domain-containing protein [Chloroflexota bacterium]